ncbi:MAG: phosphofructokinase [Chloroflexi bacterium]|nr:phosphofructokinase [Chloroflexota bacterium]
MSEQPTLVVAQSGGPTAAINASLAGVVETALADERVGRVLGARFGVEGMLAGDLIDLGRQDRSLWSQIRVTPSAALGSCRRKINDDERDAILNSLIELRTRYLVYIGGNDSADTALGLHNAARARGYDLRVIAVPKTIDNDLPETDHCPGYGSAARYIAQSTQDASLDTEAMRLSDPIKIIEVMGRDAGWLVASSVLGRQDESQAPHVLCVPERPLAVDAFIEAMETAYRRFGYAVAVVAETVRDHGGNAIGGLNEVTQMDAFGHPTIQGGAAALTIAVGRALKVKARFDKPGTLQRMSGAHLSPVDIDEAYTAGATAVRIALVGQSGCMVGFRRQPSGPYRCDMIEIDLNKIANRHRVLPAEFLGDDPFAVTDAFVSYAMPLIGPPLLPYGRLRR